MQGKLLIASPKLDTGIFARSVAMVTEHGINGTVGVVLNRPSGTTVSNMMHQLNITDLSTYDDLILMGGPIRERNLSLLHTNEWYSASTQVINSHFSISNDQFMLEKLVMQNTPYEWLMIAGSAGWAPGQLQKELDEDLWLTIDANPAIVFSSKKEELWNIAIEIYSQTMVENFF